MAASSAPPPKPVRRAALITGGARRIGRAIALQLARDGFDLAIHCHRSEKEAIALCRELRDAYPDVECGVFPCDLADAASLTGLIEAVGRSFPHLSVVVNNAAVYQRAPLLQTEDALLDEAWRVNVRAPLILAREFARFLSTEAAAKLAPAHLIQILDSRIAAPRPNEFAYAFSKCALASATELLARELAPRIAVNAIAPGSVLAPEKAAGAREKPAVANFQSVLSGLHNRGERVPAKASKGAVAAASATLPDPAGTPLLAHHPTPEDVARAVSELAKTAVLTGQIVYLDSGLRLR